MARPLREPPPTSSVLRLFDTAAAERATMGLNNQSASAPAAANGRGVAGTPSEMTGRPTLCKREVILTRETDATFEQLLQVLRVATGTRLTASQMVRALLKSVAHAMPTIQREAARIQHMKLPGNAAAQAAQRERFENRIAQVLVAGLRAAAALETD